MWGLRGTKTGLAARGQLCWKYRHGRLRAANPGARRAGSTACQAACSKICPTTLPDLCVQTRNRPCSPSRKRSIFPLTAELREEADGSKRPDSVGEGRIPRPVPLRRHGTGQGIRPSPTGVPAICLFSQFGGRREYRPLSRRATGAVACLHTQIAVISSSRRPGKLCLGPSARARVCRLQPSVPILPTKLTAGREARFCKLLPSAKMRLAPAPKPSKKHRSALGSSGPQPPDAPQSCLHR